MFQKPGECLLGERDGLRRELDRVVRLLSAEDRAGSVKQGAEQGERGAGGGLAECCAFRCGLDSGTRFGCRTALNGAANRVGTGGSSAVFCRFSGDGRCADGDGSTAERRYAARCSVRPACTRASLCVRRRVCVFSLGSIQLFGDLQQQMRRFLKCCRTVQKCCAVVGGQSELLQRIQKVQQFVGGEQSEGGERKC